MEQYSYHGYQVKPPLIIPQRTWPFVCVICHQPGEGLSASTNTHAGACRKARVEKQQKRSQAAARRRKRAL